ncbi:CGNR zinc finger domain-containing protein [Stagnihabitans tardus]|uniref:CGNR zinc finger domain-containing protein n=1 Tax=Stagnihabitans tardus TaxID=2699202 RepID=UPI00338F4EAB
MQLAILRQDGQDFRVKLSQPETPCVQWRRRQSLRDLVTASVISILADPRELERVKLCHGHDCGWLFLDGTKNARRKWCRMEVCGKRAKSSRHYARSLGLPDQGAA